MGIYVYKAMDKEGRTIVGKASSANEEELSSKLAQAGLELLVANKQVVGQNLLFKKIRLKELILICSQIHQLDKAGVSILDIIAELRDNSESDAVRSIMMDVHDSLRQGKLLSASMAEHPKVFDTLFVGLVATAEKTGSFAEAFEHLEHHLRWVLSIRSRIKASMYYPCFVLSLMLCITLVMMTVVVPKLSELLTIQKIQLPFYTTALISTSNFVVQYWPFLLICPILLYISIIVLANKNDVFRKYLHTALLYMPFFGPIIKKIELARFCRFFAVTYKSGMGVLECLYTASNVVKNIVIRNSIDTVAVYVSDGKQLAEAMRDTKNFPSMVIRMFRVGETSGSMDKALKNVNDFYDQEVSDSLDSFVGILQPLLTVFMGLLLIWITVAVFGPIYSSFGGPGR